MVWVHSQALSQNAVARGLLFTPDGALGATFWIPAVIVPLLIVSHMYIFGRLWSEARIPAETVESGT